MTEGPEGERPREPAEQGSGMRVAIWKPALLVTVLLAASCCTPVSPPPQPPSRPRPDPSGFKGSNALHEVTQFVRLGPRDSGTPGARTAAEYLRRQLEQIGLDAAIDEFTDRSPRGDTMFRNVTAQLAGGSRGLIVLLSHYDTKSGISDDFIGANDSGSSTGLLLALARFYKQADWQGPGLLFAFVDGEECMQAYGRHDGLHGSRRLAQVLKDGDPDASHRWGQRPLTGKPDVQAVLVLDMIGDRDLKVAIPRNCDPGLRKLALQCAHNEGVRLNFSLLMSGITDDHVPFLEAGMPAVDLIDFHYGSAPGKNDYWHTPQDTLDKLSPDSLQIVGRVAIRMINELAARATTQAQR